MFKNFKRYMSATLAGTVMLTSVFTANVMAADEPPIYKLAEGGSSIDLTTPITDDITGKLLVTASSSKSSVKTTEGENEFDVSFSIKNIPEKGISGYSFTVAYDPEVVEPVEAPASDVQAWDSAAGFKANGVAAIMSSLFNGAGVTANSYGTAFLTGAVTGDGGVMFTKRFKAIAGGDTTIYLKDYEDVFLADDMGANFEAYTQGVNVTVKGEFKPVDADEYKIAEGASRLEPLGEGETIPDTALTVTAATKPTTGLKKDDTFEVAFSIKNIPEKGISGYSFTVKYDDTVVEPVEATAEELQAWDGAAGFKANGVAAIMSSLFNGAGVTANSYGTAFLTGAVTGDGGVMFTKKFKVVSDQETSCNIALVDYEDVFLADDMGANFEAYSKGVVVEVNREEEESSSSSEVVTESSSEDETESSSEDATESSSEDETESTTSKTTEGTTEDATESTTESSRRPSGGGGGSPKKHTTTTTTTKPTTDNKTEPDDKNETNKPSNKPTTTPTTTSKALSFVTKTGVTVNIPKTDSSKTKEFADVKALTPWANSYIQKLTAAGIINGVSDTAFNPKGDTKRGDFMVMIAKLLGLEGTPTSNFSDVPKDKYYYNAIGLTKQIGIAAGVGGNNFDPEATITREQVMAITARVLDLVGTLESADLSVLDKFSDKNNISNYAKGNIASLVAMGIVRGDTEGKINPTNNITRAETAVIMSGVYDIVFDKAEAEVKKAETEADINKAEQEDATGEESSESTTEGETSSEVDDKEISKAVDDYKEVLEYVAAFSDYALDSADDQGRTLNEKFIDEYKDEYTQIYYDMEKYFEKYEDAKEIDLKQFAKDTTDFYNTIKDFGDKLDLAVTSNDAKSAIKDAKKDIEDSVKAVEKALAKK